MLTATYSIVAISAEQKTARKLLLKLQQMIVNAWKNLQDSDFAGFEAALHKIRQVDQKFHSRKMEKYVIPAVKNATHAADPLLEELDALSTNCKRILQALPGQVHQAIGQGIAKQKEVKKAMELYCSKLQLRLAKEDQELLPLLSKVLSGDEIFELGAQFLAEDGEKYENQLLTTESDELDSESSITESLLQQD
jgi:hypothetical protein